MNANFRIILKRSPSVKKNKFTVFFFRFVYIRGYEWTVGRIYRETDTRDKVKRGIDVENRTYFPPDELHRVLENDDVKWKISINHDRLSCIGNVACKTRGHGEELLERKLLRKLYRPGTKWNYRGISKWEYSRIRKYNNKKIQIQIFLGYGSLVNGKQTENTKKCTGQ